MGFSFAGDYAKPAPGPEPHPSRQLLILANHSQFKWRPTMRNFLKPVAMSILLAASWTAFGAGGGSMPSSGGGGTASQFEPRSPEETARLAYNAGVKGVEKGDGLSADAARQTDANKQRKTADKARSAYATALKKFTRATELHPTMYEAWNYVGYTHRKLGNYQEALIAYDRALNLKPGYAEAIEYRGHAYLGLNRLDDAKQAYLTLFAGNRKLAAQLLAAMQTWVGEHRGNPGPVDGASLDAFASWVSERSAIASQTAGLTREGASAAW
jgi:tetratricopeptide (TPR) repeat protein